MAYGSSALAKQAGATPTVDELGRMTQSSLQSKLPASATLSHWTFRPTEPDKTTSALNVRTSVKARRCDGIRFKCETTRVCGIKSNALPIIE